MKSFFSVVVGCDEIEGVSFMKRYVWIDCNSSEYSSLTVVAFVELVCYVVAVPVFVYIPLLVYFRNDVSEDNETTCEWLSPLIAPYKSKYKPYGMEILMLVRRLLIACFLEYFPANSPQQILWTSMILVIAIIFQAIVRPFKIPTENCSSDERYMGLENGIDIFMLACVLISFVYAGVFTGSGSTAPQELSSIILVLNGLFCLALSCSIIYRIFPELLNKALNNFPGYSLISAFRDYQHY